MLCLDMVVLDITMEEMNMKSIMLEAIPSIVIFVVEVCVYPTEIDIVSVVIALVSMFMIGRKSNSPSRKREFTAEKREIEGKMAAISEPATKGKGKGKGEIGSLKMLVAVLGSTRAKEIQEEVETDVAVMRKSIIGNKVWPTIVNEEDKQSDVASAMEVGH